VKRIPRGQSEMHFELDSAIDARGNNHIPSLQRRQFPTQNVARAQSVRPLRREQNVSRAYTHAQLRTDFSAYQWRLYLHRAEIARHRAAIFMRRIDLRIEDVLESRQLRNRLLARHRHHLVRRAPRNHVPTVENNNLFAKRKHFVATVRHVKHWNAARFVPSA